MDPELAVGDNARGALKTKTTQEVENGPNWSSKLHEVEAFQDPDIGSKYKVACDEQPDSRRELQKVGAVEYAPGAGPIAERPALKEVTLRTRLTSQRDRVYRILARSREMFLFNSCL